MLLIIKPIVFILCTIPFFILGYDVFNQNIIDPIEEITNPTGQWSLRFLLITLSISPLVIIFKKPSLIRFRRMLGLFAFFYMLLHIAIWLIDQEFNIDNITADIIKRNYILIGFISFILTFLLAVTSNKFSIKKLGKKWQKIHKLIYIITILGLLHFFMQSKSGFTLEIIIYLFILLILLTFRAPRVKALFIK